MKLSNATADIYTPGSAEEPSAVLAKVTHLCVAAHQDDIEIMAFSGIADCLDQPGKSFGGVVVTNGAGSPRTGAPTTGAQWTTNDVPVGGRSSWPLRMVREVTNVKVPWAGK